MGETQWQYLFVTCFLARLHEQNYRGGVSVGQRVSISGYCDDWLQVLMARELRQKRLTNEYDEMLQALEEEDEEKIEPAIRAVLLASNNQAEDLSEWIVIFEGKEYSSLEGGNYKLRVKAGDKYPYEPPEVWVLDGFEHFHVFAGGKVCYKLLNKENWKLGYSILMLVNGIIKMLHSDPEVSDPASTNLPRLIQKGETKYHQPNLKDYNAFLKAQAKRFAHRYEIDIRNFRQKYGLKDIEHQQEDKFKDD